MRLNSVIILFITVLLHSYAIDGFEIDSDSNIIVTIDGHDVILQEHLNPVGTINAFVGNGYYEPPGWLICDGRKINKAENSKYSSLVDLLRNSAGNLSDHPYVVNCNENEANLPDIRGRFLRGVDNPFHNSDAGERDDDADNRTNGDRSTIIGGLVGSLQEDAFQYHEHKHYDNGASPTGNWGHDFSKDNTYLTESTFDIVTDGKNGSPNVSSETRAKNIYTNFFIKY